MSLPVSPPARRVFAAISFRWRRTLVNHHFRPCKMSDVFNDLIGPSPGDAARIAAVIASDFRFAYFGTAAFAVRLLRCE
jgi:hypothetical protein